ncbi:putative membrane protein [Clostridium botulinum]|nr:putative membrane protein [Clostridium botulinum]APQ70635.1 putative membrane protein [Clostridium botulinum]
MKNKFISVLMVILVVLSFIGRSNQKNNSKSGAG